MSDDPIDKTAELELKRQEALINIWKQAIDTQKHFNDMCVKSRQLGLTFVAAALGAALFLFTRSYMVESSNTNTTANYAYSVIICGNEIKLHLAVFIIVVAMAAVWAVRQLDLGVYHQMLRGAVTFNEDLEQRHIRSIVGLEKGMTEAISHFSRHSDAKAKIAETGSYKYYGENHKSAGDKIALFYNVILIVLALAAAGMFVANNFMKAAG